MIEHMTAQATPVGETMQQVWTRMLGVDKDAAGTQSGSLSLLANAAMQSMYRPGSIADVINKVSCLAMCSFS